MRTEWIARLATSAHPPQTARRQKSRLGRLRSSHISHPSTYASAIHGWHQMHPLDEQDILASLLEGIFALSPACAFADTLWNTGHNRTQAQRRAGRAAAPPQGGVRSRSPCGRVRRQRLTRTCSRTSDGAPGGSTRAGTIPESSCRCDGLVNDRPRPRAYVPGRTNTDPSRRRVHVNESWV